MRTIKSMAVAAMLTVALASTAWAGTWQPQDDGRWKYQNDDGNYATGWVEDNGKSYYLDADGIMLSDTRTPDGYYVDGTGAWDGQPAQSASQGPGVPASESSQAQPAQSDGASEAGEAFAGGLSTTTSTPATAYQSGYYQVGVDIPAGEYVALGVYTTEYSMPYYEIRSNNDFDSYSDIIDNCIFDYNTIFAVKEGEWIWIDDCIASPIGEMPQIDYRSGQMFKVGYHIPAGTYRLQTLPEAVYCNYAIRPYPSDSVSTDAYNKIEYFNGEITVTVADGQYLCLDGCRIVQ